VVQAGRRALAVGCDVGDQADVAAAFDRLARELGPVDALVNCAGVICENVSAELAQEADLDRLLRVNLKGTLFAAQSAARQMIPRQGGRIVNFASQAAILSLPNQALYTASKGAVAALTRSLAIDWAPHNINVNAIAPTFVWTPMAAPMLEIKAVHDASVRRIPLGRIARSLRAAPGALGTRGGVNHVGRRSRRMAVNRAASRSALRVSRSQVTRTVANPATRVATSRSRSRSNERRSRWYSNPSNSTIKRSERNSASTS
jgi:NAD(P)-dependent dehydrogenase (short-subunit alcohol dehydrogenase family)